MREAGKQALILNLGGTAIGSSVNASPKYIQAVYKELSKIAKAKFVPAKNLMSKTGSHTDFVIISQAVTALSVELSKIANDLNLCPPVREVVLAKLSCLSCRRVRRLCRARLIRFCRKL